MDIHEAGAQPDPCEGGSKTSINLPFDSAIRKSSENRPSLFELFAKIRDLLLEARQFFLESCDFSFEPTDSFRIG